MGLFRRKSGEGAGAATQLRRLGENPFGLLDSYVPLRAGETRLYRAVREAVPVVDAAIYKIIRLVGGVSARCGDPEAEERLTEAGVLVPCPFCGKAANLCRVSNGYTTNPTVIMDEWTVKCPNGCVRNNVYKSKIFQDDKGEVVIKNNGADEARLAWNTRAAILSAEEMEMLDEH